MFCLVVSGEYNEVEVLIAFMFYFFNEPLNYEKLLKNLFTCKILVIPRATFEMIHFPFISNLTNRNFPLENLMNQRLLNEVIFNTLVN